MTDFPEICLYNTRTRTVDVFSPIVPGQVKLYCCGPTVYNYQHIGNLRTYIFEDILVRVLRYAGYEVTHVMNITDVGHLVSDADEGEDKMAVAAKREGRSSLEIAKFYTDIFFSHCQQLNILKPSVVCNATDHISQMIEVIEKLFAKGYAYLSGGNVYFDVEKFPKYGELALLDLQKLKAGARIDVDQKKRSPFDFVLWFTKSKFENQELLWPSPWGMGYPGWHIECSAMAMHYLGSEIDIHCGGIDHIPVHHTNEIAQSECASGKCFAHFWMHGGFLTTGKDKMSKSTGGFLTLDKLNNEGFDPLSYRYLCLTAVYRRELSWSDDAIQSAANAYRRIKSRVIRIKEELQSEKSNGENSSEEASNHLRSFEEAIYSDLNMPRALATLHSIVDSQTMGPNEKKNILVRMDQVLGLGIERMLGEETAIPEEVLELNKERNLARAEKRWQDADLIRSKIAELGFEVMDTNSGGHLKPKV